MSDGGKEPLRVFTETEVRGILARAAELEAATGGGVMTAAQLRRIAGEAGIDAVALEQAMKEAATGTGSGSAETRSELLKVLTLTNLGLVLAGSVLAPLAVAADGGHLGGFTGLAIFGPSAAIAAWRALRHRRRGTVFGFVREMGVFFGAFALAIAMEVGRQGVESAVAWGLVATLGGVAIANRQSSAERSPDPAARN